MRLIHYHENITRRTPPHNSVTSHWVPPTSQDRKSTRLNSSHLVISYAVFCLKNKFPLEWMQNAQQGITDSARYLQQIIQDTKPDLLHSNQFCYGALECCIPNIVVGHSDVVTW